MWRGLALDVSSEPLLPKEKQVIQKCGKDAARKGGEGRSVGVCVPFAATKSRNVTWKGIRED